MFNILDFIDSKDIREYNQKTQFTPIEQAVLIYHSEKSPFEDKMAAWRELLNTYSEEEFALPHFRQRTFEEKSSKQILADSVAVYEKALAQQERTEGMIFEAMLYESEFPDSKERVYYLDYPSAFAYIKESKQEYLDDEVLRDCQTRARITVKEIGTYSSSDTVFCFDNELRMTDVLLGDSCTAEIEWPFIGDLFVYVPVPFRKGDILRRITPGEVEYWILPYTPDEEYFARAMDWSDMIVSMYTYVPEGEQGVFECGQFEPLGFERCPDDELPEELFVLLLLRDVYRGEMDFAFFLNQYSFHGKNAYRMIYGGGDKDA